MPSYEELRRRGPVVPEPENAPQAAARIVQATQPNPARAGQATRLARQNGTPVSVAMQQFDRMQARALAADVSAQVRDAPRSADFVARNPELAAPDAGNLADIEREVNTVNSSVLDQLGAVGDLAGLRTLPRDLWERMPTRANIGRSLHASTFDIADMAVSVAGQTTENVIEAMPFLFGLSGLAAQQAVRRPSGTTGQTPVGQIMASAERMAERANEIAPEQTGDWLTDDVTQAFRSLPLSIAALELTAASRNPLIGPGLIATGVGGQTYREGREGGLTVQGANIYSAAAAAPEFVFETLPAMRFIADIKAGSSIPEMILNNILTEVPSEMATTLAQSLNSWTIQEENADRPWGDWIEQLGPEMRSTVVGALVTSTIQTAAVGSADRVVDRLTGRREREAADQERVEATQAFLGRLTELSEAAATREHDVTSFEGFMESVAEGTEVEDLYIDPEQLLLTLDQAGNREEFFDENPELESQVDEALDTGTNLRIPTSQFAARLAGTDTGVALLPHLKITPDEMSQAEGETFFQGAAERIEAETAEAVQSVEQTAEFTTSVEAVTQSIRDQLTQTNRFTDDVNSVYASLVGSFYAQMANLSGQTPEEVAETYQLNIQSEGVGAGTVLDQPVRFTAAGGDLEYGDATINLSGLRDGAVEINRLEVPEESRGEGLAREAMERIVEEADATGTTLFLTPEPLDAQTSKAGLERFYRSLGFVPNKGRKKDFRSKASMIREPNATKVQEKLDEIVAPTIAEARILNQAAAEQNDEIFYSQLERYLEESQTQSAPPQQWINTLQKAPGVKQEELQWTGIINALETWKQEGETSIQREALVQFARENGVRVDEVVLGENDADPWTNPIWVEVRDSAISAAVDNFHENEHFAEAVDKEEPDDPDRYIVYGPRAEENETYPTLETAEEAAEQYNQDAYLGAIEAAEENRELVSDAEREANEAIAPDTEVQFDDWSFSDGNDNYRELLITLPDIKGPATHWDQPSVVAHARFDDKRDADGNRVLFVEEVQSDWHQKGREQGYSREVSKQEVARLEEAYQEALGARADVEARMEAWVGAARTGAIITDVLDRIRRDGGDPSASEGNALLEEFNTAELRFVEARAALSRGRSPAGIPDAPFRTAWPELVMKRIIRHAADHGYSRVAWTTGEQQVDRYDLSAVVDHLTVDRANNELTKDEVAVNTGSMRTNRVIAEQTSERYTAQQWPIVTREEAKSIFGENITKQMFAADHGERFDVDDLRVGGEGMIQFYNRNLPNITGKLIKKHGSKVKPMTLPEFAVPDPEAQDAFQAKADELHEHMQKNIYRNNVDADGAYIFPMLPRTRDELDKQLARFSPENREIVEANIDDFEKMFALEAERVALLAAAKESANDRPTNLGFEMTPELVAAAQGRLPLFQGKEQAPRAQIALPEDVSLDPATITLLRNADLSSFLHETGHFFFEVMTVAALKPGADPQLVKDANSLVRFAGSESIEEWRGQAPEDRRQGHERVAEAFEKYLFRGRAPSVALQPLFQRFAGWLKAVYKSITNIGENSVTLTPEVTEVFDRMLASEEQIRQAEEEAQWGEFIQDRPEGMSDQDWQDYQALNRAATMEAEEELQARSLRDMRFAGSAASRELKRLQREVANLRKDVREEVAEEVELDPVYRTMKRLKHGVLDGDDVGKMKISIGAIDELYAHLTDDELANMKRKLAYGQYGMLAKEGEHPDVIAQLFDFTSGDHMIQEMLLAPPIDERIDADTEQRMLERYGDLTSPEAVNAAVAKAIHNRVRQRFVAGEAKAASQAAGSVREIMAAAKRYARRIIGAQQIKKLRPNLYESAERRAVKQHAQAKDPAEAAMAKRNQLLNMSAAKQARDAIAEMERALRYLRKFDSQGTRKNLDREYLEQIDAITAQYEMRTSVSNKDMERRRSLSQFIELQRERGLEPIFEAEDLPPGRHWRELTVDEARGVVDTIRNIEHLGRLKKKLLTAKDEREFAAVAGEITQSIKDNSYKTVEQPFGSGSWWDTIKSGARDYIAWQRKVANMVFVMDGNKKGGAFWNYFVRAANEAGDTEAVRNEQTTIALRRILAPVTPLLKGKKSIDVRWKKYDEDLGFSVSLLDRIFGGAVHMGNATNRLRLAEADNLTPEQIEALVAPLTAEHWRMVQEIWDYLDTFWADIAAQKLRLDGVVPERVENTPFQVVSSDGVTMELRGGYYPIKYDPGKSQRASEDTEAEVHQQLTRGAYTAAQTRRGHTKERVESVKDRPLRHDPGVLFSHLAEVIHDLSFREFLIDANRLLGNAGVEGAIREHYGPETLKYMKSAMVDVAIGQLPALSQMDRYMTHLRTGATIAGLGWKVWTSLLQPVGITQSIIAAGPKAVARGVKEVFGTAISTEKRLSYIGEKSEFMRLRAKTMQREINEVQNTVAKGSKADQMLKSSYFVLITSAQYMVDAPTWAGVYATEIDKGTDEDTAIALADQAVRDAQGGGQVFDLAAMQRGGVWLKLWTNFISFMNVAFNLATDEAANVKRVGVAGLPRFAVSYALIAVIPSIIIGAMRQALYGEGEDDPERYLSAIMQEYLSFNTGMLFGLREVQALSGSDFGYSGPAGARFFAAFNDLVTQSAQGEADASFWRAANNTAGVVLHYPAGQLDATVRGAAAIGEGEGEPQALLVGPRRGI